MQHSGTTPLPTSPAIELRLLGTETVRTNGGREVGSLLVQPKRFALLASLALAPRHGSPD